MDGCWRLIRAPRGDDSRAFFSGASMVHRALEELIYVETIIFSSFNNIDLLRGVLDDS
jgi:hypothetical protein